MIKVTNEMLTLLREYQMGAYGEMDDDCDKRMIAALIELHEQSKPKPEPFVYYKKQPWGYDECNYDDEGSFPLYEAPLTREPLSVKEIKTIATHGSEQLTDGDAITVTRLVEQAHGIGVTDD